MWRSGYGSAFESLEPRQLLAADLAISNVQIPASASVGHMITLQYDVTNNGPDPADYWTDLITLSPGARYGGDIPTQIEHDLTDSPLAPGASITVTKDVPALGYRSAMGVRIEVNDGGYLDEADFSNNVATGSVQITMLEPADLTPTDLQSPAVLWTGQVVELTWMVSNLGPGTAGYIAATVPPELRDLIPGWTDAFYFSTDAKLDKKDVLLFTSIRSQKVDPNQQYPVTESFTIPPTAAGQGYLLLQVNSNGMTYEKARSNNVIAIPVTINGLQQQGVYSGMFMPRSLANVLKFQSCLPGDGEMDVWLMDHQALPFQGAVVQPSAELASAVSLPAGRSSPVVAVDTSALAAGIYTLRVTLRQGGQTYDMDCQIVLVDAAARKAGKLGDAVGGSSYEIHNIDVGNVGDMLLWRIGTNFWNTDMLGDPTDLNGDFLLTVGKGRTAARFGVAVADRTTGAGATVVAGALYTGVTATRGEVVGKYFSKIDTYSQEVLGQSFALATDAVNAAWDYNLFGGVLVGALGITGLERSLPAVAISHAMYCGNDHITIPIPPRVIYRALAIATERPRVLALVASGDRDKAVEVVALPRLTQPATIAVGAKVKGASKDPIVAVVFEFDGRRYVDTDPKDGGWTLPFAADALTPDTNITVTAVATSGLASDPFFGMLQFLP